MCMLDCLNSHHSNRHHKDASPGVVSCVWNQNNFSSFHRNTVPCLSHSLVWKIRKVSSLIHILTIMPQFNTRSKIENGKNVYQNIYKESTSRFSATKHLLFMWTGSCFKLIWHHISIWIICYTIISVIYRILRRADWPADAAAAMFVLREVRSPITTSQGRREWIALSILCFVPLLSRIGSRQSAAAAVSTMFPFLGGGLAASAALRSDGLSETVSRWRRSRTRAGQ